MTGKDHTIIDASDFIKGMNSGPNMTDGGFANDTQAVNLTYEVGTINGVADMVNRSTNMSGEAIGHCVADGTGTYFNGYVLTDNGTVLGVDGAQALTASSALSGTYQVGTSDITNFFPSGDASKIYITSTNDIARMNIDLSAGDATWWSVTLGKGTLNTSVRHPLLQFIGYTFVGNGNVLARIESSTSGTANHLVLAQQNQITALGIDAGSGQMLIATTQGVNYSGTVSATNKVFVYNGESPTPDREIPVDGMITAFRNVGGLTLVGVGRRLGYWNGSGITYLRTLKNASAVAGDLIYKHHITNINNTIYVIDGTQILAYGEVHPSRKVFYYAVKNTVNSNNFSLVFNAGDEKLGLGFATSKFYTLDTVGTGTGSFNSLKTLKYSYPKPINIKGVYIEYAGNGVANEASTSRTLSYRSGDAPATSVPLDSIDNTSGSTTWETKNVIGVASNPVRTFQLVYSATASPGIKRFIVYHDPTE